MQEITIEIQEAYPFATIRVAGWLAQTNVYQLKHEINRLVEYNGFHMIVLDLADIGHLDSGGVSVVMGLFRLCRDKGGLLTIVEPRDDNALNPMYSTHLSRHIAVCASQEAALRTISRQFGISLPAAILDGQIEAAAGGADADDASGGSANGGDSRFAVLEEKLDRIMQRMELLEMSVFSLMDERKDIL